MKKINHNSVKSFIINVLVKNGFSKEDSTLVANSLVETSLRGVDSHGVRLFPHYVRGIKAGRINNKADIKFSKTSDTTLLVDADSTFGHIAGLKATKEVIKLAKEHGMASAGIYNSTHFGAAAIYGLEMARNNMIGLSFTHADALVVPFNGKRALFGTNPICFTAPAKDDIFCLDMSTSQVSYNKVATYREDGKEIEKGWAVNEDGLDVINPNEAVALKPSGLYKGQGLGMMVEILCSLLTGAPYDHQINRMFDSPIAEKRKLGHFVMAIDISKFQDLEFFKDRLSTLMEFVRAQESISDMPVMASGDPEVKMQKIREKEGIPFKDLDYQNFLELSKTENISLE